MAELDDPAFWSVRRRRRWAIPGSVLSMLIAMVLWGANIWTRDGRLGALGGLMLIPWAAFTAILIDWS